MPGSSMMGFWENLGAFLAFPRAFSGKNGADSFGFDPLAQSGFKSLKISAFNLRNTGPGRVLLTEFQIHAGQIGLGEVLLGVISAKRCQAARAAFQSGLARL